MLSKPYSFLFLMLLYFAVSSAAENSETNEFKLYKTDIVQVGDSVAYVKFDNGTIYVSHMPDVSSIPSNFNKNCEVFFGNEYYDIEEVSYKNGKILIWSDSSKMRWSNSLNKYESDPAWKFLSIELETCAYNISTINSVDHIKRIIPFDNTFLLFAKSCNPCQCSYKFLCDNSRYSIPNIEKEERNLLDEDSTYEISYIEAESPHDSYLQVLELKNCSTLLRLTNAKFEVTSQRLVNSSVSAYSTNHNTIRVCWSPLCNGEKQASNIFQNYTCELMDRNLNTISMSQVAPAVKDSRAVASTLMNMARGGAVYSYVADADCFLGDGEGALAQVFIQEISADNQVSEPIELSYVQCWQYHLQSFEFSDDKYCIVADDGVEYADYGLRRFKKCLQMGK